MNRRSFLKFFGVATVAIATSTLRAADLVAKVERPPAMLEATWFQTTRVLSCYSDAYLASLAQIMARHGSAGFTSPFNQ